MIILGIILIVAGLLLPQFAILVTIGIICLVIWADPARPRVYRPRFPRPAALLVKGGRSEGRIR